MNVLCKIPACPWPTLAHGLCHEHLERAGLVGRCPHCKRQFIQPHPANPYRFCSRVCTCRANNQAKMAVPRDRALLERLYVRERLSVREIGRRLHASWNSVCRALQAVGIPCRSRAPIPATTCCEAPCDRPAFNARNGWKGRGSRRCRFHTRLREAAHHARYRRDAKKVAATFRSP